MPFQSGDKALLAGSINGEIIEANYLGVKFETEDGAVQFIRASRIVAGELQPIAVSVIHETPVIKYKAPKTKRPRKKFRWAENLCAMEVARREKLKETTTMIIPQPSNQLITFKANVISQINMCSPTDLLAWKNFLPEIEKAILGRAKKIVEDQEALRKTTEATLSEIVSVEKKPAVNKSRRAPGLSREKLFEMVQTLPDQFTIAEACARLDNDGIEYGEKVCRSAFARLVVDGKLKVVGSVPREDGGGNPALSPRLYSVVR